MKIFKYAAIPFVFVLLNVGFASGATAQTATSTGVITSLSTGWGVDTVAVTVQGPIVNPGNCATTQWYKTDTSIADSVNEKAVLIAAHMAGIPVTLYISGCSTEGFPRIISVVL